MNSQANVESTVRVLLTTLSPKARARLIAECADPTPIEDRLIRRAEVARKLSRSTRAVDLLAAQGVLHKIVLPGRTRGGGYRLSEVQNLLGERA